MEKTITVLATYINAFRRRYVCLCGHKTNSREAFMQHINTHPDDTIGVIDFETGKVAF